MVSLEHATSIRINILACILIKKMHIKKCQEDMWAPSSRESHI